MKIIRPFVNFTKGSFDDLWPDSISAEEAYATNQYVQLNYEQDEKGRFYLTAFHVANPEDKRSHKLDCKDIYDGIGLKDIRTVYNSAEELLNIKV